MKTQMIFDKGRDKEITVVIPRLAAQGHSVARFRCCVVEGFGAQLLGEEVVRQTLIDKQRQLFGGAAEQLA